MYNYLKDMKIEKPLDLILDSISDGVLMADRNGKVIYVNSAYCQITGVKKETILGSLVTETRKGTRLPDVLKSGKKLRGIRRQVGNVEYITDIVPIIIDGQVVGAISLVRDITSVTLLSKEVNNYSSQVKRLRKAINTSYKAKYTLDDIVGSGESMQRIKKLCRSVAQSPMAVLIYGESGVGKELFAHAIHNLSDRAGEPFVAINCSAFPPSLLLSELFGYEEGAFTGASKDGKMGLFEIANKGTLFLDEIGDMDYELQSKLLRVLETGEFTKVGGILISSVDVRIISATNKKLEDMIEEKKFREDLYYRLNPVTLDVPPLRERREDIVELAEFFLAKRVRRTGGIHYFSDLAKKRLREHDFPGNVRELINVVEFSACVCQSEEIQAEDLLFSRKAANAAKREAEAPGPKEKGEKISAERNQIEEYLQQYGNSVEAKRKIAKLMGISLATLYNRIREYNILPQKEVEKK